MVKQYRSREGEATAVDTKTQLTTLGSETAPGPLLVPEKVSKLVKVIIVAIQNMAAATGYSGFVRLEGSGLPKGPEVIAAIAGGNAVATGGNASTYPLEVNIDDDVSAGSEILVFAEMAGTDVGQVSFGVTLVFR